MWSPLRPKVTYLYVSTKLSTALNLFKKMEFILTLQNKSSTCTKEKNFKTFYTFVFTSHNLFGLKEKMYFRLISLLLCAQFHSPKYEFVECDDGTYGYGCANNCSVHCLNDSLCNKQTGHCDKGCDPGYTENDCSKRKCLYDFDLR